VGVRGGWRLYSSGPGIYVHAVRASLLGLRESFGELVFDPVLPKALDGLIAHATLCGRPAQVLYRVRRSSFAPSSVSVNGTTLATGRREANPYREGGLAFSQESIGRLLSADENKVVVEL
jgi:CRISPR-associated protein Csx3